MRVSKAVITAASIKQRKLPLQTIHDATGKEKTVLEILIEEAFNAGIESVAVIVAPGDEVTYAKVLDSHITNVEFIPQHNAKGYGHALLCAKEFIGNEPFLHMVGDHMYITTSETSCVKHIKELAEQNNCAVSAVQSTRESLISNFGTVSGKRIQGTADLYKIDTVIEKPSPTLAEQELFVPGLRTGHYLCFFGIHVLTPSVFSILEKLVAESEGNISLSPALQELCNKEQYLAVEKSDLRYDLGAKYGLLKAQLAIALNGSDKEMLMNELLDFFAVRDLKN